MDLLLRQYVSNFLTETPVCYSWLSWLLSSVHLTRAPPSVSFGSHNRSIYTLFGPWYTYLKLDARAIRWHLISFKPKFTFADESSLLARPTQSTWIGVAVLACSFPGIRSARRSESGESPTGWYGFYDIFFHILITPFPCSTSYLSTNWCISDFIVRYCSSIQLVTACSYFWFV